MRQIVRAGSVVLVATLAVASLGAPAHAAGPSGKASCVGQVFVPQATGEPGTVAARIHVIKDEILPDGENFGGPISGLARDTWCRGGA